MCGFAGSAGAATAKCAAAKQICAKKGAATRVTKERWPQPTRPRAARRRGSMPRKIVSSTAATAKMIAATRSNEGLATPSRSAEAMNNNAARVAVLTDPRNRPGICLSFGGPNSKTPVQLANNAALSGEV